MLFYGLAHILIREGWIDRDYIAAHTEGFEEFCWHVEQFTPERRRPAVRHRGVGPALAGDADP